MASSLRYWVVVVSATLVSLAVILFGLYFTANLNQVMCGVNCSSEFVESPLDEPVGAVRLRPALSEVTAAVDPDKITVVIESSIDEQVLGPEVSISVIDLANSQEVLLANDVAQIPASSLKLVTVVAALEELGPDRRFSTRVAIRGDSLILIGGGDPVLSQADLKTLARETATELRGATGPLTVDFDDSLFSGPSLHPDWSDSYFSSGASAHVVALRLAPKPRARDFANPTAEVLARFVAYLDEAGLDVTIGQERTPAGTDRIVAEHVSEPLRVIAQDTIRTSNNYATEVLGRHVALAMGREPSFAGAALATTQALQDLGVSADSMVLADVSGLSRRNLLKTSTVATLLSQSLDDPEREAIFSGLPVAGVTGTLGWRFADDRAIWGRGMVRAKTGTLNNVSSLSGVINTADGGAVIFSLMTDQIPDGQTLRAQDAIDILVSRIAQCDCRLR